MPVTKGPCETAQTKPAWQEKSNINTAAKRSQSASNIRTLARASVVSQNKEKGNLKVLICFLNSLLIITDIP